jgi:parvulin-like peptidyl-prolyl isomerase
MKRSLSLLVAVVAIALAGSACSSTQSDAATIKYSQKGSDKETSVTRADLLSEVQKIVENKPFATWLKANKYAVNSDVSTDTGVSAIWLSQLIHQKAIDALFASRQLKVSPAIQAQAAKDVVNIFPTADIYPAFDSKFRSTLADRQARTEALLASYTDTSDAAGQKYFKAHESEFACASGRNVAHILVKTQAEAQDIVNQLKAGASFATLAQKDSTDTQSGAQGGSLGCLVAGTFVPAFQTGATAAPFDTPVIVKSQFGYHVILATHAVPSYEASRTRVLQTLAQRGQATAQVSIDALLKAFNVHLDPRFGTWGLSPNGQGTKVYEVTPPKAPKPSTVREGTTTVPPTTLPATAPGAAGGTP